MAQYDTIIRTVIDTVYLQSSSNDVDMIKDIVEISNSSISNQISTLNIFIAGFSLIFVIAGIFLGIYILNLEKRVVIMKDNIGEKERKIIELAKTVEETDQKIQSNISGLYSRLQEEESLALLKRLDEEPQDISNLGPLLLARKLKQEWFPILKSAFLKLLQLGEVANEGDFVYPSYKEQYLLLFFQHYMKPSMLDNNIREELCPFFSKGIMSAFKRDIITTTLDLCSALSDKTATFDRGYVLTNFLKALNNSKYSDLEELKNIFENNIANQSLLPNAIETCTCDNIYLSLFGIESPKHD